MTLLLRKPSLLWLNLGSAVGALTFASLPIARADAINMNDAGPASYSNPIDLKLGPFDFQPRASSDVRYDDNILFSENPESDVIWDLRPGLQAVAGDKLTLLSYRDNGQDPFGISPDALVTQTPDNWPGRVLLLDDSPLFEWFTLHPKDNYIGNVGRLNAFLPETKFILGASFLYDNEPITVVQAGQYSGKESITATVSGAYFISDKTSVDSAVTYYKEDYQLADLVGYTEWRDATWFNYQWTGLLNVSAGLTGGLDDVPNGDGESYAQLLVRARYQYAEKVAFNASMGGELRHYDSENADSLDPVFDLGGSYELARRTYISLDASRSISASVISGFTYTTTGVNLSVNQGITDRLGATLTGGYSVYEASSASKTAATTSASSDYYSLQFSINLKITSQLQGQVFYNFRDDYSKIGGNISDDVAGLQLSWKY